MWRRTDPGPRARGHSGVDGALGYAVTDHAQRDRDGHALVNVATYGDAFSYQHACSDSRTHPSSYAHAGPLRRADHR